MLIEGVAGKLIILVVWIKMIRFWRTEVNGLVVSPASAYHPTIIGRQSNIFSLCN